MTFRHPSVQSHFCTSHGRTEQNRTICWRLTRTPFGRLCMCSTGSIYKRPAREQFEHLWQCTIVWVSEYLTRTCLSVYVLNRFAIWTPGWDFSWTSIRVHDKSCTSLDIQSSLSIWTSDWDPVCSKQVKHVNVKLGLLRDACAHARKLNILTTIQDSFWTSIDI